MSRYLSIRDFDPEEFGRYVGVCVRTLIAPLEHRINALSVENSEGPSSKTVDGWLHILEARIEALENKANKA